MKTAVYPGSFDPITNGHLDIVERALKLFDRVIIAIGVNQSKGSLFSLGERLALATEVFKGYQGVEIDCFEGLLMNYVKEKGAQTVIRGLRAISDFEYEFQMANMNRKLYPDAETVFLMTGENNFYLSSSLVKEVASLGACVQDMVPSQVFKALCFKYGGSK